MTLRIRLSRGGAKKRPFYRIVVADSRFPRDGRFIERVGTYNPLLAKDDEQRVTLKQERIKYWLGVGARPSDRVTRFLGQVDLFEPTKHNNPLKGQPREKTLERIKAKEEAAKAAAEAPPPEPEEAPVEDAAAEDAPAEDTPAEDAAAEDAPAEDAPAEDAPAEDAPAEEAPTEEAPAEAEAVAEAEPEAAVEEPAAEAEPEATADAAPEADAPAEDAEKKGA